MSEIRDEVLRMAHGALTLNLAFVGVAAGLFDALHTGPATVPELARYSSTDEGYVLRWCDAAYAFGLLDRDQDRFVLTERGRAFLPHIPGTLMPVAVQSVLSAHLSDHAVTGLRTGKQPGEVVLGERENVGRWFGAMLEASFAPIFASCVLPEVPAFASLAQQGATVCDLACGNGWILRHLAHRFPTLRGHGLDGYAPNIDAAIRRADSEALADRISFSVGDILGDSWTSSSYHLVLMHRALHHVWTERERILAQIAQRLVPGGSLVVWEPRWPDDPAQLREMPLRPMAFQNLSEHVQGNHFLRPDEVSDAMARAGLTPSVHLLLEGREMVIVGQQNGR